MTWTKLDDRALDDPRALELSRTARLLHIEALVASNGIGLDGRISRPLLRRITDEPDPAAVARELVAAGLWRADGEGWQLLWLLDDQPTAAEVAERREYEREKKRRQRRHALGDHSLCPGDCPAGTPGGTTAGSPATPTRPVPTRPEDGSSTSPLPPSAAGGEGGDYDRLDRASREARLAAMAGEDVEPPEPAVMATERRKGAA
jgi:hypothetical protein